MENKKKIKMYLNNIIEKHFSQFIAIICLSLFIFNFWLFYPGYIIHDWAYVMTYFNMNNWHPVIYPFLLKYISFLFGNHVYTPLLFNLIPFYLGIYFLVLGCWKRFHSKWCLLGFLTICISNLFFNNIFLHSSYSSPMWVFLLWAMVLYQILVGITYKNLVAVSIAFIFALISRHNAIIQVYPIFFIYSWFIVQKLKPSHRLLKYIVLMILLAFITIALALGIPQLLKQGQSYPSTHVFLHQIAGACIPNHDESCFLPEWYVEGKTYADVEKVYREHLTSADEMSTFWCSERPFKGGNLDNLHSKYFQSIFKYPTDYLLHISRFINAMWFGNTKKNANIADNKHCFTKRDCEWLRNTFDADELFYDATFKKITVFNFLQKVLPTIDTIHFVSLNFILFVIFGIIFIRKKDYFSLYILSSSLAGIAASIIFCAFSPVTDSRYIYPVLVNTVMAVTGMILYFCDKNVEMKFISEKIDIKTAIHKYRKHIFITIFIFLLLGTITYIYHPLTARVDVSVPYSEEPIVLVHRHNISQPMTEATWMPNFGNRGVVVQQLGNSMTFTITALQDADINIILRGPDVRDSRNQIMENWVKYTSFKINGISAMFENQDVWHNKPFKYVLKAKKNNAYVVELKWRNK